VVNAVNRRRLFYLGGFAVFLVLVVGITLAVTHRSDDVSDSGGVPQDELGTVVLVPGYGGGTDSLDVLARTLEAKGRKTLVVKLPGDGTGDLEAQARVLQTTVDGLLASGQPSVDVVGYSAGGVVARIWATDLGGASQTRRVVLLGSPNHGTQVAALGTLVGAQACGVACKQLVPGSDLLEALAREGTPEGPEWVSLWTTDDQVVTPPESAELDGATNLTVQSVCPGRVVDHGSLPRDAAVQGLVLRALAVAPFAVPPPSECDAVVAGR
jgi:triacylglycerol esterase/lipase EstA (alpha/beta hydrolase family)